MFINKSLEIQHLNRKHFSLDEVPHFAFRVKCNGWVGGLDTCKMKISWKHLYFRMCGCIRWTATDAYVVLFVHKKKKSPSSSCGWGVFLPETSSFCLDRLVHVQKGTCGLWVTVLKEISLGGLSVFFVCFFFFTQYINEAWIAQTHFPPPFFCQFQLYYRDFGDALFYCYRMTEMNIITSVVGSLHWWVMDSFLQRMILTGSDWTIRWPEGKPFCLSCRLRARNDETVSSPYISALIPLCLALVWFARIVRAVHLSSLTLKCCLLCHSNRGRTFRLSVSHCFVFFSVADHTIRYCYINYQSKLFPPAKAGHALTAEALVQVLVSNAVLSVSTSTADVGQRILIRSQGFFFSHQASCLSSIHCFLSAACSTSIFSSWFFHSCLVQQPPRRRLWCEAACVWTNTWPVPNAQSHVTV